MVVPKLKKEMSVSDALRATRRGALKYDTHWLDSGKTADILALCSQFTRSVAITSADGSPSDTLPVTRPTANGSPGLGGVDSETKPISRQSGHQDKAVLESKEPLTPSSAESESSSTNVEEMQGEALSSFELAALKNEIEWDVLRKTAIDNRRRLFQTQWEACRKKAVTKSNLPSVWTSSRPRSPTVVITCSADQIIEGPDLPIFNAEDTVLQRSFETSAEQIVQPEDDVQYDNTVGATDQGIDQIQAHEWTEVDDGNDAEAIDSDLPNISETNVDHSEFIAVVEDEPPTEFIVEHPPDTLRDEPSFFQDSIAQPSPFELQSPAIQDSMVYPVSEPASEVEITVTETQADNEKVDPLRRIRLSQADAARFTSSTRLAEYKKLIADFQRLKEDYDNFQQQLASGLCSKTADRTTKGIRQELTVAITTTINLLNKDKFKENLHRLGQLLSGIAVPFRTSRLSIGKHPQAKLFCCDLIAKTLVKQAESVVSAQPEMAYLLASVAVSLWVDFPEIGEFLKAIVMSHCPYMIPYYIPRLETESDQEYYTKLGYQRDTSGTVEKQHLFLKRMGGICRFWTAIMCTPAIPWATYPARYSLMAPVAPHPMDFGYGWTFLVNLIQLTPRMDITATILFEFLEVTSHFLKLAYGRQFEKLLQFINDHYMLEISKTSAAGVGAAAVIRLKTFLNSGSKTFALPADYPARWRR